MRDDDPYIASPELLHHGFHEDGIPSEIEQLLEELYQSPFCVKRYFDIFREGGNLNAVVFSAIGSAAPRHVLVYTLSGRELTVLNELFWIEPEQLRYAADTLFGRYPALTTITFAKINCTPERSPTAPYLWRLWSRSHDIVVELPSTFADYQARLGKQTQKHLRYYQNRLQREYADFAFHVAATNEIDPAVIGRIIEMNHLRMKSKQIRSGFDRLFEERIKEFCRHYGLVTTVSMNGKIVAGTICYEVGDQAYLEAVSHDPEYNKYNVGQLCLYLTVEQMIHRGKESFHLLWGENEYKYRFLGVKRELYSFSLYRSGYCKLADVPRLARHMSARLLDQVKYLWRKYVVSRFRQRR